MPSLTLVQTISIWILPVIFAITLHEAAHAYVANFLGDTTAKMLGRLSLNPLKHIDPIGTVLIPILVAVLSGFQFVFGYAKPVPINSRYLKNPRRDTALVAIAGPLANVVMALLWALCVKVGLIFHPKTSSIALFMVLTGEAGILINLVLGFLNVIPIPPLDGSRVVSSLLPQRFAYYYAKVEPYGFLLLVLMLLTGVLGALVSPPLTWTFHYIHTLFGL